MNKLSAIDKKPPPQIDKKINKKNKKKTNKRKINIRSFQKKVLEVP